MSLLEKEHLRVILLDTRNHVVDIVEIYEGSINSSQVRVAEVFKPAVVRDGSCDHSSYIAIPPVTRLPVRMMWQSRAPSCKPENFLTSKPLTI